MVQEISQELIILRSVRRVANLHNKEAALTFISGYVANEASLNSLASILPNAVVFSIKIIIHL